MNFLEQLSRYPTVNVNEYLDSKSRIRSSPTIKYTQVHMTYLHTSWVKERLLVQYYKDPEHLP